MKQKGNFESLYIPILLFSIFEKSNFVKFYTNNKFNISNFEFKNDCL